MSVNTDFGIGYRNTASPSGTYYNGSIDQVRIFNSAISASNVTDLYNEKPEVDTSNFKAVIYDGTGSTDYISNVGMDLENDGGLIWFKERNGTNSHQLYDNVRGYDYAIYSNLTDAQYNYSTHPNGDLAPASVEANGFFTPTVSNNGINRSGGDYVSWVFKAGGDAVLNEVGDIDSQVSANTAAGFSIVKWSGATSTTTVGHGLNSPPEVVIRKNLAGTSDWAFDTTVIDGSFDYLFLNTTAVKNNHTSLSAPTSTVFSTGGTSFNSSSMIAYCWHSVAGYSKIGSYTGSGVVGKRIYVTNDDTSTGSGGFKPSFVMIKCTSSLGANQGYASWVIHDDKRAIESTDNVTNPLYANRNYQEGLRGQGTSASGVLDLAFNDDGSTINHNGYEANASAAYIYMAFK